MDQTQLLTKLSGEERLNQAFLLSDFVRKLAILNIKEQLGKLASKKEIMEKLRQRIYAGRS